MFFTDIRLLARRGSGGVPDHGFWFDMAEGLASKRIARGYSLAARTGACASALAIGVEKIRTQVSPNSEPNRGEFSGREKDVAEKEVVDLVEKISLKLSDLAESPYEQKLAVYWLKFILNDLKNPCQSDYPDF